MELKKEFSEKAKKDFELLERAREQNDQKAYAELMERYKKPLYHTIYKMVRNPDDAEDLTIEAMAKAFRNLHKFNPDYTFSTWLFRIATNNCIDFIRKKKLETSSLDKPMQSKDGETYAFDVKDSARNPQEESIRQQKIEVVKTIVTKLPPKYQLLISMRYFDELSYEEIADSLNFPLGTVKARLHRAKELLYDIMKKRKDSI